MPRKDMDKYSSFASKIMNGAIAGTIGVTCTYPLDLCKTRLQNQLSMKSSERVYKNLMDCLYKVIRTEGITGCYRGLVVNVLLVNPEKAIKLAVNDQVRQMMGGKGKPLPLRLEVLAGGAAGLCQVTVTTPMEMLKIQMQVSGRKVINPNKSAMKALMTAKFHTDTSGSKPLSTKRNSALSLTKDLLQTKGFTGMYRGLGATLLRDIPFSCIHFTLFSYLNFLGYGPNGEKSSAMHNLFSGVGAGLVSALTVTPCDVIKTRLQVIPSAQEETKYYGIRDCARKIYRHEGFGAFFKGAVPRMIVIGPLFGIAQTIYLLEISQRLLGVSK